MLMPTSQQSWVRSQHPPTDEAVLNTVYRKKKIQKIPLLYERVCLKLNFFLPGCRPQLLRRSELGMVAGEPAGRRRGGHHRDRGGHGRPAGNPARLLQHGLLGPRPVVDGELAGGAVQRGQPATEINSKYTVKKGLSFCLSPAGRDVTNQTLPGLEILIFYSRPRRVWLVTSRHVDGKNGNLYRAYLYFPETHIKRQATRHGCLPSFLGDGDK